MGLYPRGDGVPYGAALVGDGVYPDGLGVATYPGGVPETHSISFYQGNLYHVKNFTSIKVKGNCPRKRTSSRFILRTCQNYLFLLFVSLFSKVFSFTFSLILFISYSTFSVFFFLYIS
jgi:hypothetical protein